MARAHTLGGRGVHPNRWSQLTLRLWGMAAPNGAGSQAWWTGSLAQLVVAAHYLPGGMAARKGAGSQAWGTRSLAQPVVVALGALVGDGCP